MKVGLYFDLRNPHAWQRDPSELYASTLDLCEEADELGIDSIWVTEHHGFDDGYLTQPFTMAAAIAARTTRARIGTGVALAPLHSAVEIAEQAAIVDLISGGRFELGLGAGYRPPEFTLYGADYATRYAVTMERVDQIRQLWADNDFHPKPVQSRIPIWLGFQGPRGARRAGLAGEGLLSAFRDNAEPYLAAYEEAGHPVGDARMGGLISAWVSDDPEATWPEASKYVAYQADSYREHGVRGTSLPAPTPIDPERLRARTPGGLGNYLMYGRAAEVAQGIRDFTAAAPVDMVFLWASFGGMPVDLTRRHIHQVCNELGPMLRALPAK